MKKETDKKEIKQKRSSKEVFGVKGPKESCSDSKCPFHGEINVKNETFVGKVVKKDVNRSATIEWSVARLVPKYERFETRRIRLRVHNPTCLNARRGEKVKVARTKPLSKTIHHVIIQKLSLVEKAGEKGKKAKGTKEETRPKS